VIRGYLWSEPDSRRRDLLPWWLVLLPRLEGGAAKRAGLPGSRFHALERFEAHRRQPISSPLAAGRRPPPGRAARDRLRAGPGPRPGLPGAASLLALVPLTAARTAAGFALALFFPATRLLRCLRTPTRPDSLPDLLHCGAPPSGSASGSRLRSGPPLHPDQRPARPASPLRGPPGGGTFRPRPPHRCAGRGPAAFYLLLAATLALLIPPWPSPPPPGGGETRGEGVGPEQPSFHRGGDLHAGLPPVNPFLQSDSPFYYHTFFHILLGPSWSSRGRASAPTSASPS